MQNNTRSTRENKTARDAFAMTQYSNLRKEPPILQEKHPECKHPLRPSIPPPCSLVVDLAVPREDLALELLPVLVPQLGGLAVQRRGTGRR